MTGDKEEEEDEEDEVGAAEEVVADRVRASASSLGIAIGPLRDDGS